MGLWEAGTIEGLTVAMLQRVAACAYQDHNYTPRECDCRDEDNMRAGEPCADWCATNRAPIAPMLKPHAMPINEVAAPDGDMAFDRVSFARWNGQRFWFEGRAYVVETYAGKWGCRVVKGDDTGALRFDIPESTIARQLNAENGAHPDPYIACVEVTYDTAGHRAGYGVRRSGSCSCWYD